MKNIFLWGVSSSAFQIEGDDGFQGRGKSVWDYFCEIDGKIFKNHNAKVSTDHYNKFLIDLDLMQNLGINSYRFSTSWSRLIPEGIGKINQKGIDFYDRLIDEMLKRNIEPFLTFYHWDLPQKIYEMGGFLNPDFYKWFSEYTNLVVNKYGDRVKKYITFNEPINVIRSSFHVGVFAPGITLSELDTLKCVYHFHQAHSASSRIIAEKNKDNIVGIAMSTFENYPLDCNNQKCVSFARERFFERNDLTESIDLYLDPALLNVYPKRMFEKYPQLYDYVDLDEVKRFYNKNNVLCYNNYSGTAVDENGNIVEDTLQKMRDFNGRAVDENGLYWGAKFLVERYNLPLYISENGFDALDKISCDEKVHDDDRVEFFRKNLRMVEKLYKEIDLRGYFIWSLLDNFEWTSGYKDRYGIVYVDFESLKRIPKDSYYYIKDYLQKNNK